MSLILAQGAEHVTTEKMRVVVEAINNSQFNAFDCSKDLYVSDKYEIPLASCGIMTFHHVPYVVEEKFDGYSYLNDNGRFFSKRLSEAKDTKGQPIEKTGHIPHLAQALKQVSEILGIDVHGELHRPGGISDDVTKIMGCNEDEAVRRQEDDSNKLHYMLIDIRKFKGMDVTKEPYYIRRALLEYTHQMIHHMGLDQYIHIAPILYGDPVVHFRRIVRTGGEGLIIKKTDAIYNPGKKPAGVWIKAKKKITLDVVILGFNDGTGKNKQLFGSIEFGLYVCGKMKKMGQASSGLDDATRLLLAHNPEKYINTVMEIESIQESVNSFRNAVFLRLRDDKDAIECTPNSIRIKEDLI